MLLALVVFLFIVFKYLPAQAQGIASTVTGNAVATSTQQREKYRMIAAQSSKVKHTKSRKHPQSMHYHPK